MPTRPAQLRQIADERLRDAASLMRRGRYDGAFYISGYAIELLLKAKIWEQGLPDSAKEIRKLADLVTHDLAALRSSAGMDNIMEDTELRTAWSVVAEWQPELRYARSGHRTRASTRTMIRAVRQLWGPLS